MLRITGFQQWLWILFATQFFFAPSGWARPEYAVKQKQSCVSCHFTPWGGGPRNLYGKVFGSHGYPIAKTSSSDWYYGDLRLIAYYPKDATRRTNGLALMEAAASANAQIHEGSDGSEFRALLSYNLSPLAGSRVREAYMRWQLPSGSSPLPSHVLLGSFYVPFGLLTDEHRTYTRIQTNMTENNFDVGAGASGEPVSDFHYDLVLVNDFQTGGAFVASDLTFGTVLNLRWNPTSLPFFVGVSANYEGTKNNPNPYAFSAYAAFSLDQLSGDRLHGSLQIERVDAQNWNNPAVNTGQVNPSIKDFFVPPSDPSILTSALGAHSIGYYGLAKYDFNPRFLLFYKLDYLALDSHRLDQIYHRHGVGMEGHLNSNLILNVRVEKAFAPNAELANSNVLAAQDDIFAMLRLWF